MALVAACAPAAPDAGPDGDWVGTITAHGEVTTVVNESGSVWGGVARLVEEMSIGVEAGADEYMFGAVTGVYATEDHIYVVDRQVPAVRMYTHAGEHVRDIGREGQGPGEYGFPGMIKGDGGGRLFLQDHEGRRFNVYSDEGEVLDTWHAQEFVCCSLPMVLAPDGLLWTPVWHGPERSGVPDYAAQGYGPNGPVGAVRVPSEPEFARVEIVIDLRGPGRTPWPVPFTPLFTWNLAPSGAIVAGASDRYRFAVESADGPTLIVEHYRRPAAVDPDEADWYRRRFVASLREITTSPGWTWDGAEMPQSKPAFQELIPQSSGGVWVVSQGPGERLSDCVEDPLAPDAANPSQRPCWRDSRTIDAFSGEGRYLGEIETFSFLWPLAATTFVRGNRVFAAVEDEAGTIMVKRYRLVLPSGP